MNKELICFAIIPLKNRCLYFSEMHKSNIIYKSENITHIGNTEMKNNTIINSENLLFISNEVDSSSFRKRLKFCWKFLFHYK